MSPAWTAREEPTGVPVCNSTNTKIDAPADCAFAVAAQSEWEWNCLPDNVRYCQSPVQFLSKLKTLISF